MEADLVSPLVSGTQRLIDALRAGLTAEYVPLAATVKDLARPFTDRYEKHEFTPPLFPHGDALDKRKALEAAYMIGYEAARIIRLPDGTERHRQHVADHLEEQLLVMGRSIVAESPHSQLGATHSPDYRSVNWFGVPFTFSPTQAACVKVLWLAWENKTPEVGDATILEEADSDAERLPLVFRDHDAWGTMIVKGSTKGTHRLANAAQ